MASNTAMSVCYWAVKLKLSLFQFISSSSFRFFFTMGWLNSYPIFLFRLILKKIHYKFLGMFTMLQFLHLKTTNVKQGLLSKNILNVKWGIATSVLNKATFYPRVFTLYFLSKLKFENKVCEKISWKFFVVEIWGLILPRKKIICRFKLFNIELETFTTLCNANIVKLK